MQQRSVLAWCVCTYAQHMCACAICGICYVDLALCVCTYAQHMCACVICGICYVDLRVVRVGIYARRMRACVICSICQADRIQARICRCGTIGHCTQRPVKEEILQRFSKDARGAHTSEIRQHTPPHPPVQCCCRFGRAWTLLRLCPRTPGPHGINIATFPHTHFRHGHASTLSLGNVRARCLLPWRCNFSSSRRCKRILVSFVVASFI